MSTADRDLHLQGRYAGIVSRFGAFVVDALTVTAVFALAGQVFDYVASALTGDDVSLSSWPAASRVAFLAWAFFYCAYSLGAAGRTLGMALLGLRVVEADGSPVHGGRAVLRVLAFPLSFLLFGLGFLLILLKRDRRALHDLVAGTAVVYSWDARAARLRFLAREPEHRPPAP